jgi:glycoside/pentoside/hexuronide:cation symporter, GPH family
VIPVNHDGALAGNQQSESPATPYVLSRWTLLAYSSLALPLSLAEIPIIVYLPAFYAKELRLSAGLVGMVFLSARLWDCVSDILIGWFSDRSRSRWGRRKPWVILAAPFLMVSLWFLCNPPQRVGPLYLGLWAALFYPAWTAVKIPYISWGAELSTGYVERSRVVTFRETFMMLGNLLFAGAPLVFLAADAPLHQVLSLISLGVLCMMPLAIFLSVFVGDPPQRQDARTPLLEGLASLTRDRVLIRFIVATLLIWTAEGIINSLAVFSVSVGLQLPNKLFWIILILYTSMICAVPFTLRLARYVEKHQLMAGGMALFAIAIAAMLFVPKGSFAMVAAAWIVAGIANSAILTLPTSILADIVDRSEVATGAQRSGAYMAFYYLVIKIGLALGVGVSFGLLEVVHFDPSAEGHSAADALNIRLLGFGLPSMLYAAALLLYLGHPITRKVQWQLRQAINLRKQAT